MRLTVRTSLIGAALVALSAYGSASLAARGQHQHPAEGAHHHPAAARLKNPVAANAASIDAGKALYAQHCSECHGDTGDGDGMMGDDMDPKPARLNDADWKHGSTDGEIFTVVRDGVNGTEMKSFSKKMSTHQVWDVVNYLRTIGPAKSH